MTRNTLKTLATQLPETGIELNQAKHHVWRVLAPFCAMRYINYERYLPGYGALENDRLVAFPQNIVEVYQTRAPDSQSHFQSGHIVAIRTVRNIDNGE